MAEQVVPIVWPFAIGSTQSNFVRAVIDQANKDQKKYTFIFEHKPGAGGSVAAKHVDNHNGLSILASSASFFVRPQFYPNESHDITHFKPVLIQCTNGPYLIVSSKYKTLSDVRKQKELNIGVILGSITEANARQLQRLMPNTKLNFIGYQNTNQPTQDMLAGNLDLNVDLPSSTIQWVQEGKIFVLGSSGTAKYPDFTTWKDQGVSGFTGLVTSYFMAVKSNTDPKVTEELHQILRDASNNNPRLSALYKSDFCSQANLNLKESNETFANWTTYWPTKLKSLQE